MVKNISVLYIDDDYEDFLLVDRFLKKVKRINFCTKWGKTYKEGFKAFIEEDFDVCLLDYKLLEKDGIEFIKNLPEQKIKKPIIFITGKNKEYENLDFKVFELGAMDYLEKDKIDSEILERAIVFSIERKKYEKDIREQNEIKNLILESTTAGICIVDNVTSNIIEYNKAFQKMFHYDEDSQSKNIKDLLSIKKYNKTVYNQSVTDLHECAGKDNCPCVEHPIECRIDIKNNKSLDCSLSCRSTDFENGIKRSIRIMTFYDISRLKATERELLRTQKDLHVIIRDHAIDKEKPLELMELLQIEMDKFSYTEGILNGRD